MYDKIVLVTRKTRLEGLIERFNTRAQAKFYLEHSGGDFNFYAQEHERYYTAVDTLRRQLQTITKLQVVERSFLPNFLFTPNDIVVTIGIDGLVVNTAKYLTGQPLVAVNPDPQHIDGILLPFQVNDAPATVRHILQGEMKARAITMAEAKLNDGQSLLAFNDFFVGARTHVSARYHIQFGPQSEYHSSSGIIISTGVGATGWLSSLFNMANGMVQYVNGNRQKTKVGPPSPKSKALSPPQPNWEQETLLFVVREPFISKTSTAGIVCGTITPDKPLIIKSNMADEGVIFSDGVEADYLAFNASATATICLAPRKTNLVIA